MEKTWTCKECGAIFEKRHQVIGHGRSHSTKTPKPRTPKPGSTTVLRRRRSVHHDCKWCGKVFETGSKLGGHTRMCSQNPKREQNYNATCETNRRISHPHSQETKEKISNARKAYLDANPDKVPYLLNHYSKGPSYPEKYFADLFKEKNVQLVEQHQVGRYCLDFAILDKRIDIEIDGEQHYLDPRIVESDKNRTRFLEGEKWSVVRVRWSMYQALSKEEKESFIDNLIAKISGL